MFAVFKRKLFYKDKYARFRPVGKWEYAEATKVDSYKKAEEKKRKAIINQIRYCKTSKVEFKIFELDEEGKRILDPPPNHVLRMFDNDVMAFEGRII